jgi:hypothetical protein
MHRLLEIAEWFLIAAGSVVVFGVVVFAALAFRLNHPPRD